MGLRHVSRYRPVLNLASIKAPLLGSAVRRWGCSTNQGVPLLGLGSEKMGDGCVVSLKVFVRFGVELAVESCSRGSAGLVNCMARALT